MLRLLTSSDYSSYTNLISQLASHFELYDSKVFTRLVQNLPTNYYVFLYEDQNIVIGTIKVLIEQKWYSEASYVAHIEDVVIDASYRGQGHGSKMIGLILDFCRQKGCYKVVLYCKDSKAPFYEKNGFMKEGTFLCKRF